MCVLLRFGNEEAQRRLKQQEKEEARKERAAADAADAKRAMKKVKHTQASIGKGLCSCTGLILSSS